MIDTLRVSKDLIGAGFTQPQAESLARITTEAISDSAATKADLLASEERLGHRFDLRFAKLEGEVALYKWVNLTVLGLVGAAAVKYLLHL